ncbi:MAG: amidophosphoribosyltransferase [Bacteroidota bacterium]
MSDPIHHECGIAVVRLRKPYSYYLEKYGDPMYAIKRLYLLMEKQHNRGQDGAGVGNIKLKAEPGRPYMSRLRSVDRQPIADIFGKITKTFAKYKEKHPDKWMDANALMNDLDYTGEVWLGHLRYGTHGENTAENCHPMLRVSNWRSRSLMMAGNFNMTNVDELFDRLLELGQHPREKADTVTVLEKIGHFLDEESQSQFRYYKDEYNNRDISGMIETTMDLQRVLRRSCRDFDGGYAMAGLTGYGAVFVARDPAGIRPAYYYADNEVIVVASEKPAIKTAFGAEYSQIREIEPGHALIINKGGQFAEYPFIDKIEKRSCSFERIYFSRGNDPDIYRERKMLGSLLCPQVLEAVDFDLKNSVFSYIPNTAETSFLGMVSSIEDYITEFRRKHERDKMAPGDHEDFLQLRPRMEKLVIKDAKLRTFITDDDKRDDLVSHVYDTTYEVIRKHTDTIVVIDDSIVRGTTLEKSILTMLDRLQPKRIVVVSSAPQIRFPDCYGIDMSRMKEFVAFRAVLVLLHERGLDNLLDEVYDRCAAALAAGTATEQNFVKAIYEPFTDDEISDKIAEIVTPEGMKAEVKVIYQTVDNLHKACPNHSGDWYFTGNYPTPGGNRVVNTAFVNFMEGKAVRAY